MIWFRDDNYCDSGLVGRLEAKEAEGAAYNIATNQRIRTQLNGRGIQIPCLEIPAQTIPPGPNEDWVQQEKNIKQNRYKETAAKFYKVLKKLSYSVSAFGRANSQPCSISSMTSRTWSF